MGIRRGSISTPIIADGLIFNADPANRASYIPNATTSFNTIDLSQSGTLENGVAFIQPPISSSCWDFDGSDDYIDCGNPTELQITGALTISCWVKYSTNLDCVVISKDSGGNRCWALWPNNYQTGNNVELAIFSSNSATTVRTTSAINDGAWHHISTTFTPSTSLKIYLDGLLNVENTTSIPAVIDNDAANVEIGRGLNSFYYNGNIGPVHIYNRALSSTEVLHNYNALKSRFE